MSDCSSMHHSPNDNILNIFLMRIAPPVIFPFHMIHRSEENPEACEGVVPKRLH